jgi:hypothetical protein
MAKSRPHSGPTAANRCGTSAFQPGLTLRRTSLFPALQASEALLYAARCEDCFALFPGSSVVEQPAVNRLVAGSNPARGANAFKHFSVIRPVPILMGSARHGDQRSVCVGNVTKCQPSH